MNVYLPQSPSIQLLRGDLPNVFCGSVILLLLPPHGYHVFLCLTQNVVCGDFCLSGPFVTAASAKPNMFP